MGLAIWESALLCALLIGGATATRAQAKPDDDASAALRRQALELYRSGKFVEAMPLLARLSAVKPSDYVVKEHWAYCILEYSKTLADPEERKAARLRARSLGLEAQKQGDKSELVETLLSLPEDGSDAKFSDRKDVDDAMRAAEAERARGDLDRAREAYLHVLQLDPKNYEATTYVGDAYFSEQAYNQAGEWFARAIQINPNREIAYRFWADALAMAGRNNEAREKYIDAVIAEPYNRQPWVALRQWAERIKQPFNGILLENKSTVKTGDAASKTALDEHSLREGNPETAAWNAYTATRHAWQKEKFRKEFPGEDTYRRSLKEEAEALDALVGVLAPDATSEKKAAKLDPSLLALVQIDRAGLLEPFVLLNRADREIARDYPGYRDGHRNKLFRYMDEYVLPKEGAQP
jgi:tetratricopeptide (TPR) repeat protein